MSRFAVALAALGAALSLTRAAAAGGMYLPDNGTEALGRGGAFTAKADDPTAIYYNVAGLAQQRGTRLLVNANVSHSTLDFQRSGVYPGDPAKQSFAGKKFPNVESEGGVSTIPFIAATSDFGLENVTFALGTFAPPAAGGREYPEKTKDGLPSPVRYDATAGGPGSILLFHTAAVAFKINDYVEVGAAFHLAQVSLGQKLLSYMGEYCQNKPENPDCDAGGEATLTGWSPTGSAGVMVRPDQKLSLGLHVMGPTQITAQGVAKIVAPKVADGIKLPDTRVAVSTALPAVIRAGVRKTFGDGPQPKADLELNATYELWDAAMNPGPTILLEKIPPKDKQLKKVGNSNYHDTLSLRLGGSVTPDLPIPLTLRGGVYYDMSATDAADTRLDRDTLDKIALTVGAGFRFHSWRLDVAYASVFDISRTVEKGTSADGAPATNEGAYTGHWDILSLGVTMELDVIFGGARLPPLKRGEQVATR